MWGLKCDNCGQQMCALARARHGQASYITAVFDIPTSLQHLKVRSLLIESMYHLPLWTARQYDFNSARWQTHTGRVPTHTRNNQARKCAHSIIEKWNIALTESSIFFVFFPLYFSFVKHITTIKQRASGNYGWCNFRFLFSLFVLTQVALSVVWNLCETFIISASSFSVSLFQPKHSGSGKAGKRGTWPILISRR